MCDALYLLVGGSAHLYVILFAVICAALEIFSRYERYVSILKWGTLSLFAYLATVLVGRVPWSQVVDDTLMLSFSWQKDYFVAIVAVLGTTISPYLFFWQASEEAEDEHMKPGARPLMLAPGAGAGRDAPHHSTLMWEWIFQI